MPVSWPETQRIAKGSGISQSELAEIYRALKIGPVPPLASVPAGPPLPAKAAFKAGAATAESCGRMTADREWLVAYRDASASARAVMTRTLKRACEDTKGCSWKARSKTCIRGRSKSPKRKLAKRKIGKKKAAAKKAARKPAAGSLEALRAKRDSRGFEAFTKAELLNYFSKARASALRKRGTARPLPKGLKDLTKAELARRAARWYK